MRAALLLACAALAACYPAVKYEDSAQVADGGGSADASDDAGDGSSGDGSSGDGSSGDGSSGDGSSGDGSSGDGSSGDGSSGSSGDGEDGGSSGDGEDGGSGGDEGADTSCTAWADADGDGYGAGAEVEVEDCDAMPSGYVTNDDDCDDSEAAVSPAASEICNGIDDDCDGDIDADDTSLDTSTESTWYVDGDGDGYGDASGGTSACDMPSGYVDNADDCDDSEAAVSPAASEICNGIDDDCDGDIDDSDASLDTSTESTWYVDGDGDGYGDASGSTSACDLPSGYADNTDDCNDSDGAVNPGASEICNGIDDDCDTAIDSAAVCPCNLETYGGHNYLFCETVSTWHDAEAACEAQSNYKLAVITDATEQAWVWATAAGYDASYWWWIGLHNQNATASQEPDGAFEWVDGSTVSYTEWYPYYPLVQPDDYWGVEDCVHIDPSHGFWNDLDCGIDNWYGTEIYYICESVAP